MYSPFTKITYILTSLLNSLEQFLRAIWNVVSWAAFLILPQMKLNSQLSHCAFFKDDSYGNHEGRDRVNFSPLPELYKDQEAWYQQRSLASICLLRESRRIWVSLSWLLDLPCCLMNLSFIWWCIAGTCPRQAERYWGGGRGGAGTDPVERYQGLLSCRRLSGLGWVVRWEADLMLFLNGCLNRICQGKSKDITWERCSEKKGQDSSRLVTAFSVDWETYGSGGCRVLVPCSGPIGETYYREGWTILGAYVYTLDLGRT